MNWFRNLRTITKLMISSGLLCAVMVFLGYWGLRGMETEYVLLRDMHQKHALGTSAVQEANIALIEISRAVRNAILDDNAQDVAGRFEEVRKARQRFVDNFALFEKSIVLEKTKVLIAEVRRLNTELIPKQDAILELARAGKDQEAQGGLKEIRGIADGIDALISEASNGKLELMNQSATEAEATYQSARLTMITILIIAVIAGLAISVYVGRLVANPLSSTIEVLNGVAGGDFTRRLDINTRDEVGLMAAALNQTIDQMRNALLDVKQSSENVAAASEELASASQQLSSGAQQQASSLEETAASLEEITSTVKQNADNAKQANQLAGGARDAAEKGGEVVSSAVSAMNEINASSKRIADIITAIDEIAFQTNLLALNAAVEAARAGEQGRGFAVVAAEVRNLAQRSATAAKEIKSLIQDSVRKVENGSVLVNQSGQTLSEIVNAVKRVTDIVAEITAASQEQSAGIEQVNKAMTQMDQVTQSNSAQTEELSSTAQSLSSQAQQLQALAARFRLESGGNNNGGGGGGSQPQGGSGSRMKPAAQAGRGRRTGRGGASPATVSRSLSRLAHKTTSEQPAGAVAVKDGFEEF
jgi:methyl-accepting chemotaxis protein